MGWYRHWFGTHYYTLLYGHRDETEAGAWVEVILAQWRLGAGARVLDLACGRGRHAAQFAERGLNVTGIDISEDSIAEARRMAPNAEFYVRDMREAFPEGDYDGVCCLFTSMGYFDTPADDQLVFDAVASGLRTGGRFVLDFMNTHLVLRDLVPTEEMDREGVHFVIERQLIDRVIVKRITATDHSGTHRFEERVQALYPEELEAMAVQAGLEILARTDGPELTPFDPDRSSRFVLWTRKPDA